MNKQNIFISYSNADKKLVYKIADRIKEKHSVWIDRDYLKAGAKIDKEKANGVRNSSLFIFFVSKDYCNSNTCDEEFSLAKKLKKKMLAIMLEKEATNGFELTIVKLKRFDAFKPPNVFSPWSEDLYSKLLDNILDLTQEIVPPVAKNLSNLAIE